MIIFFQSKPFHFMPGSGMAIEVTVKERVSIDNLYQDLVQIEMFNVYLLFQNTCATT